jgi:hypothetical protein
METQPGRIGIYAYSYSGVGSVQYDDIYIRAEQEPYSFTPAQTVPPDAFEAVYEGPWTVAEDEQTGEMMYELVRYQVNQYFLVSFHDILVHDGIHHEFNLCAIDAAN